MSREKVLHKLLVAANEPQEDVSRAACRGVESEAAQAETLVVSRTVASSACADPSAMGG